MNALLHPSMRDTDHGAGWRAAPLPGTLAVTERNVRRGFALALVCLGLVGGVAVWSSIRLDDAVAWVARSQEMIGSGNMLLADVTDAETEERGYIMSGDDSYRRSFQDAVGRSQWELERLRQLTAGNPDSEAHLARLAPLIAERLRNLTNMVELRRSQGFDAASSAVADGPDRGLHDAILVQVDALTAAQTALLTHRQTVADRTSVVTKAVISGGSAFAAAVVGFVLFRLRRDFARRMRTELAMAQDLRAGIVARRAAQDQLMSQIERLNLLHHITRAIGERQDLPSIYAVVVETLESHLPVDLCGICAYDPIESVATVTCANANGGALAVGDQIAIAADGLTQLVGGELVYAPDLAVHAGALSRRMMEADLRSLVVAPLQDERKVVGLLLCARRLAAQFNGDECEFVRQVSEHVALAAHQTELRDALRKAYDDLRQSQREALQLERLRVLGQLASGVAHDINNTISPVSLYLEALLEEEPGLSAAARRRIDVIRRGVGDVAQTVSLMRDFSRQLEPRAILIPVALNQLIGQVVELTRARWSDMPQQRGVVIDLRTDLEADLPAILGIENELRDALVNLVFNAVEAMPQGGPLTVSTRSIRTAKEPGHPLTTLVRLQVADAGIGMDDDTRRRCMEPFFTTKGERGTGLGLAMVYGTMQRHGADIRIDSQPGAGTTFGFDFPTPTVFAVEATPAAPLEVPALDILLIDDDPLVAGAVRETLLRDGHRVQIAVGGQSGIDAFRAAHSAGPGFRVVITDMGMPHVDGGQVADAVRAIDSHVRVILLTGWGQRLLADAETPPNVDCVVSKPPTRAMLRAALAAAQPRDSAVAGALDDA